MANCKITTLINTIQSTKRTSTVPSYSDTNDGFADSMLEGVWNAVFTTVIMVPTAIHSLCRVFTAICRLNGNLEKVRVLYYHIMMSNSLPFPSLGVAIAGVWPFVLAQSTANDENPVLTMMQHVNKCILTKGTPKPKYDKLMTCFMTLCGWDRIVCESKTWMRQFFAVVKSEGTKCHKLTDKVFNIEKALQILLKYESMDFFKEQFQQCGINQVSQNCLERKANTPVNMVFSQVVLRLHGYILPKKKAVTAKYVNNLINKRFSKMLTSNKVPTEIQLVIVNVMLEISFLSPSTVFNTLHQCYSSISHKLPANLLNKIRWTRSCLVKRFPGLKCPEF